MDRAHFQFKKKQDRVFPSSVPLMDSMDLTSLKFVNKYKSKFNVNIACTLFCILGYLGPRSHICITVSVLHFFTILSMFLFTI